MNIITRIHLKTGESFMCELDENMHLAKNLQVYEVANREAADEVKLEIYPKSWVLFEMFQFIRDKRGKATGVNSGYRTKAYNDLLPTASKNSLHLKLYALDIKVPYKEQPEIIEWIFLFSVKNNLVCGVNRYPTYMHIDVAEDEFGHDKFVIRDKTKDTTTYRHLK